MAADSVSAISPNDFVLINTTNVATSATTQTISGLGGVYKELRIAWSLSLSGSHFLGLRFNNDSNDRYSGAALQSDFGATTNQVTNTIWLNATPGGTHIGYADWENCNATSPKICIRSIDTTGGAVGGIYVGTSAISSVSLVNLSGGNINSGSTIWLWGKI